MAESNFNKRINRYTANRLNGALVGVEEVVKLLQFKGPSWTGLYSNSWQIRVGKEKRTGLTLCVKYEGEYYALNTAHDGRPILMSKENIIKS